MLSSLGGFSLSSPLRSAAASGLLRGFADGSEFASAPNFVDVVVVVVGFLVQSVCLTFKICFFRPLGLHHTFWVWGSESLNSAKPNKKKHNE